MKEIETLAKELCKGAGIGCVVLSGSRTNGTSDNGSDYDLYAYSEAPVPIEGRRPVLDQFLTACEYDHQYWETEDIGYLKNCGTKVEIMYRTYSFAEEEYDRLFHKCLARIGYSTCVWHNLATSRMLHDEDKRGAALLNRFAAAAYPKRLRDSIIAKNFPILRDITSSYYNQVAAAIQRNDCISVQHRSSAFLASYFDILFAINEKPHPGEKRLIRLAGSLCPVLPKGWDQDVNEIVRLSAGINADLLVALDRAAQELRNILPTDIRLEGGPSVIE